MLNFYKLEQRIEQGMQKGHVPRQENLTWIDL